MDKLASPQHLRQELRRLDAMCQGPEAPHRETIAQELHQLSLKVAGGVNLDKTYKVLATARSDVMGLMHSSEDNGKDSKEWKSAKKALGHLDNALNELRQAQRALK
jgi:hypothetical protein